MVLYHHATFSFHNAYFNPFFHALMHIMDNTRVPTSVDLATDLTIILMFSDNKIAFTRLFRLHKPFLRPETLKMLHLGSVAVVPPLRGRPPSVLTKGVDQLGQDVPQPIHKAGQEVVGCHTTFAHCILH